MKIFKHLIYLIFIPLFLCKSIHAIETKNTAFNIVQDKLIKTVVAQLQSNAIGFDDENLIIYANPSFVSLLKEFAGIAVSGLFGAALLSTKENKFLSLIPASFIIYFVMRLIKKLKLYSNYVPVIKMDNTGIIIDDSQKIKWTDIIKVSSKYSPKFHQLILNLYDKKGKVSSTLKPDDNFITIPISQISKIIQYCVDEVHNEKKEITLKPQIKPLNKPKPTQIITPSKKVNLNIQSPIKKWLQRAKKRWH